MVSVAEGQGSYELTASGFRASSRGNYECTILAFAKRTTNEINTLEISNPNERINTYHHELTHLTEGANPFLFPSSLPFSYEIRKCLIEGRAAFNEDLLELGKKFGKMETLTEKNQTFNIISNCGYCLYKWLYILFISIYDYKTLEELSQNSSPDFNSLEHLRSKFPLVDTNTIFAHLMYILACYQNTSYEELSASIQIFKQNSDYQYENLEFSIKTTQERLASTQKNLETYKLISQKTSQKLTDPVILNNEYESAVKILQEELKEELDESTITVEEYQDNIAKIKDGSMKDIYIAEETYYLKTIQEEIAKNEKWIITIQKELTDLLANKDCLLHNPNYQFNQILAEVCLENPSLENSLKYLENLFFNKIFELSAAGNVSEAAEKVILMPAIDYPKISQITKH